MGRPVQIYSGTWAETDNVGVKTTLQPWNLFFSNSIIQNKLNNFAWLQCDLHVKFVINASPFYYGAMMVNYQPLTVFTPSTISVDSGTGYLTPHSQRPHIWLEPQLSKGGQIDLPFFRPNNWLRTAVAADFTGMGTLSLIVYSVLQSANAVTGTGVTVTALAWASNVKLSGPSVGLTLQSKIEDILNPSEEEENKDEAIRHTLGCLSFMPRPIYDPDQKRWVQPPSEDVEMTVQSKSGPADEYGKGPVSSVASAVAAASRELGNVPVIGPFATATSIGAGAISDIARLFGWTNVPVIRETEPYRPTPFPPMSVTDAGYPMNKLTLDSKNELSVDPKTVGLSGEDEMAIACLAQKESYIATSSWDLTQGAGTILFSTTVEPRQYTHDNTTTGRVNQVPMCWLAQAFEYWKGDIILRGKIICSPFHKGRLQVSYDPDGTTGSNVINTNTPTAYYTKIIDIGVETDFEVRFPYQQPNPWVRNKGFLTFASIPWSISASPTFNHDRNFDNGTVVVRVLNALTAPVSTSTVNILWFVRGAENLEFACPCDLPKLVSVFQTQSYVEDCEEEDICLTVQSAVSVYPNSMVTIAGGQASQTAPERYLCNHGEAVYSIRQILRRMQFVRVWRNISSDTNSEQALWILHGLYPSYFGYDPAGYDQAKGLIATTTTEQFNWSRTTFFNWFAPAFVGMRGSMMYSFNTVGPVAYGQLRITRRAPNQDLTTGTGIDSSLPLTASLASRFYWNEGIGASNGTAIVSQLTNAGLSVVVPNYNFLKFNSTYPVYSTAPGGDGSNLNTFQVELSGDGVNGPSVSKARIFEYCSVGTDFNLFFFLNVPTMFLYSGVPTGV